MLEHRTEEEPTLSASDSAAAINGNAPAASILVVDDEAGIRESLEVLLGFENYIVKTAGNGEEGLQLLDRESFDLV
ncbi:MAG: response regulator, partial [Terracidiphilus sp.]